MPEENSSNVEETHNGVKKEGDLNEIKDFAEDVKDVMEKTEVDEDSIEKYDDWRPTEEDDREEIKEKTVKATTETERKIEEDSEGTLTDISKASKEITEASQKLKEGKSPDSELKNASREASKPIFSKMAGLIRRIEEKIFSTLMMPLNGYYFDSEDIAVDLKDKGDGKYEMDVKMTEEEKKDRLKKEFKEGRK